MSARQYNLGDTLLRELDTALRVVAAKPRAQRLRPDSGTTANLTAADQSLGSKLMRVNHSGEIAAQALYRGQALVARDTLLRSELLQSAAEEHDHLAWCQQRTEELGGQISRLTPLWYAGSFVIGMVAGLTGDKRSLGFLAETERQVTRHLDGHLQRLPEQDTESRAILEQMREDEIRHADGATTRGGTELPKLVRKAMGAASKVMTTVSFRL